MLCRNVLLATNDNHSVPDNHHYTMPDNYTSTYHNRCTCCAHNRAIYLWKLLLPSWLLSDSQRDGGRVLPNRWLWREAMLRGDAHNHDGHNHDGHNHHHHNNHYNNNDIGNNNACSYLCRPRVLPKAL
jgi:hypothetical protein